MARMYSRKRGKSGSKKPLAKKTDWVKERPKDVEEIIVRLAKERRPSAEIGLILRDQYGIPSARMITKNKISRTMKKHDLYPEIPEDLFNLIKEAVNLASHIEKNKKDYISNRGLELTESKIRRMAKYYKRNSLLPKDWKWDPEKAKLMIR
jgi:small subunit ribosomal protein S15